MTITIDPELEMQFRNAAEKLETDADSYVQTTLRRHLLADISRTDDNFDSEMQMAMNAPLNLLPSC